MFASTFFRSAYFSAPYFGVVAPIVPPPTLYPWGRAFYVPEAPLPVGTAKWFEP